jgi:hypothetical protein
MNDLIVFAQLVGVSYFMSVGFGMIVAQGRGVKWMNQVWLTWAVLKPINLLGQILISVSKPKGKKKRK